MSLLAVKLLPNFETLVCNPRVTCVVSPGKRAFHVASHVCASPAGPHHEGLRSLRQEGSQGAFARC
eukprot:scaffold128853_cov19-Tisochrysis_lutea.AAC.1